MSKANVLIENSDIVNVLLNFLNNPWVFTTLTGVMSALLWFLLSKFFDKKERKETNQKIASANNEILYAVRASISDGIIPQISVFDAIISSVARKYGLRPQNLLSISAFLSEIIREIMESSFISNEEKNRLCDKIIEYKSEYVVKAEDFENYFNQKEISLRKEFALVKAMILIAFIIVTLMCILIFLMYHGHEAISPSRVLAAMTGAMSGSLIAGFMLKHKIRKMKNKSDK